MSTLDQRSQEIFRLIVEEYLKKGIPVGSRTISQSLENPLSPATIRHIMAEMEEADLLSSPHTSAGRQPTQKGLRFYVDTLMKIDNIDSQQQEIERKIGHSRKTIADVYADASTLLSGLSSCIGLVIAPKVNKPIRKIEFLKIEPRRILAILIMRDGTIENRVFQTDNDPSKSELEQASNYLNELVFGKTLPEILDEVLSEIQKHQDRLSQLSALLIKEGVIHPLSSSEDGHIFVNGQSRLFEDPAAQDRLNEIRDLLAVLEEKKLMARVMSEVEKGEGVQIFIGSENTLFHGEEWSTILRAYRDQSGRIVGATGIIGPTRLNYGKIVPIVDYTSLVIEKLISGDPF